LQHLAKISEIKLCSWNHQTYLFFWRKKKAQNISPQWRNVVSPSIYFLSETSRRILIKFSTGDRHICRVNLMLANADKLRRLFYRKPKLNFTDFMKDGTSQK
jgi:hypothetical protein